MQTADTAQTCDGLAKRLVLFTESPQCDEDIVRENVDTAEVQALHADVVHRQTIQIALWVNNAHVEMNWCKECERPQGNKNGMLTSELCLCACVRLHVCVCVCVCACIAYRHMCVSASVYTCMSVYAWYITTLCSCTCVHMCACARLCVCAFACVCMCRFGYVCIYI